MFKNGIPEWAIPSLWVGLIASFFLAFHRPMGALIAAIVSGSVIAFGYTRAGRETYGVIFIIAVIVVVVGGSMWLGSLI